MTRPRFTRVAPRRRTLVEWLLRRRPPRNAIGALIDTLNAADSPRSVTAQDIARIERDYGVSLKKQFLGDLERLYREYMLFCLTDRHLSDDELDDLAHLGRVLGLDAAVCDAIHRNVTRQVYFKSVADVLRDGTINEDERAFLRRLQEQLAIPPAVAQNMVDVRERQVRSRERPMRRRNV